MFPLKQRKLIRGCQAHINAGLGCGADYVANYVDLFSPFIGKVEIYSGVQGGKWLRLTRTNGDAIEFAHLDKYLVQNGDQVQAGLLIAKTGNTGTVTTGPHLHVQIFRDGKRLDPEQYNWEDAVLPPSACQAEKEEIRRLNTEIGVVTKQRDDLRIELANEKEGHVATLEQLKTSQAEVTKLEEKVKVNQTKIDQIKGIVL